MGRPHKCKYCLRYLRKEDGTAWCSLGEVVIDVDSTPVLGGNCWKRKEKRKLTPEELHAVRSAAGRKSGYGKGRAPTKPMSVRLHDYKVFVGFAQKNGHAIVEQFHIVARQMLAKYPELKPPEWID